MIAEAKALDDDYGKKLSIFWGNPEFSLGAFAGAGSARSLRSRGAAVE